MRFSPPGPSEAVGTKLANWSGMPCWGTDCRPIDESRQADAGRRLRTRRACVGLVLALCIGLPPGIASVATAVVDVKPAVEMDWRQLESIGGRGALPSALAHAGSGDVAVGDEAGVSWWRDGLRERATLPPVRDLDFDSTGILWIGTLDGLYLWQRADRPTPRRMGGGEASNRIHRIAVSQSAVLLATGAGAYWSSDGKIFQPLRVVGATTAVSHVAIRAASFDRSASQEERPHAGRAQAWIFGAGRLSLIRGLEASSGLRVTDVHSVALPRPGGGGEPVDLVIDPNGERLFLVFEDLIAWRSLDQTPGASSSPGWQLERPTLPPGARIRRLGWAAGRVWIATDHGLLSGENLNGPFRRAASPVGTTDCIEIQARALGQALALCRSGLFALGPRGSADPSISTPPVLALPPDPPLAEIRRHALVRAGLTVHRSQDMWERLRRRALWPEVGLRFDADIEHDTQSDSDQTFVSGDTRYLKDRARDEGHRYRAAIELDWDLGGAVYPLETVDLSRELRQIMSLRDDVADEINQLYFERQAIREKLAVSGSTAPPDVTRLHWRAQELEAGLDAWTGGWISQWRALQSVYTDPVVHPDHTEKRTRE
jgi:hypothetical protein